MDRFAWMTQHERAVLGSMLLASGPEVDDALRVLSPSDFEGEARRIFEVIAEMRHRGEMVTERNLALEARLSAAQVLALIHEGSTYGLRDDVRRIVEQSTMRAIGAEAERILKASTLDEMLPHARRISDRAVDVRAAVRAENLDEFLDVEESGHDWLIPLMLERMDRVMLVALEGGGKSTLMRQLAVLGSQGRHPFTGESIRPFRALIVDLENAPFLLRRKLRGMRDAIEGWDGSRCLIAARPEGFDMESRADRLWLTGLVASAKPDVVCLGPTYKMLAEEEKGAQVRVLQAFLDDLRARFRFALVLETHAPHSAFSPDGEIRPAGSRLWLRWADQILRLVHLSGETWRLEHVRTPRDRRDWPRMLTRGGKATPWRADDIV